MKLTLLLAALTACSTLACTDRQGGEDGDDAALVAPVDTALVGAVNTAAAFAGDMAGRHEGFPRGFDYAGETPGSLAWIKQPRVGYGRDMPEGWNALIPWGQVYADTATGRGPANPPGVRFQLRNLQHWVRSRATQQWRRVYRLDDIAGANYAESFEEDANVPADIRPAREGGGITATIVDGYNFHFFGRDRVEVDPRDIADVWAFFEARLVLDPGADPALLDSARLIASAGGDYWLNASTPWDQWKTNGDWAIGRFKYLTPEWQAFNAHTVEAGRVEELAPLRE